jgi:hypothetical protein
MAARTDIIISADCMTLMDGQGWLAPHLGAKAQRVS